MRTNAPRLVTMALAVALTVAGLYITGTLRIPGVGNLLKQAGFDGLTKQDGYFALLASPVLLIAGSFLPNL